MRFQVSRQSDWDLNPSHWEREILYHEGDLFFSDLLHSIQEARETIDLETYILDKDHLGYRLLKSLKKAASRGVRVRLLLDGVGCAQWSYPDLKTWLVDGFEIRFFHPLPWQQSRFDIRKNLAIKRIFLGLWKLNRRNHRKVCVIDNRNAYLGGMNVSTRHSRYHSGDRAWRDTSTNVTGKDVIRLKEAFEEVWRHPRNFQTFELSPISPRNEPSLIRLNSNRRERGENYRDLLRRIIEAENRVWITNPYFVPEMGLLRALRFAAWTGRDVRLLFPKRSDVWMMNSINRIFYSFLLAAGVRIFEYVPSVLHAKTVLIDQWSIVGSSNLNHRSLLHDLEADVILTHPKSISELESQFATDLRKSKEIHLRSWRMKHPILEQFLGRLTLTIRRWL